MTGFVLPVNLVDSVRCDRLPGRGEWLRGQPEIVAELARRWSIVLDPPIGDEQVGILLRTMIGMDRMRAAQADRREPLSRDHGHMPTGRPSAVAGPQVLWATSDIATVAVGS